jgi:glycosyl transferase family 87
VIGLVVILAAVLTALLAGACLRLPSLVSTLLASYLAFVANLGLVTLVLSPFREVTRGGLAVAESVLLAAALGCWWLRGRPRLPLASARTAFGEVVSDRVTLLFFAAVVVLLGYELLLGLTVPPNNFDSLTYHLARVAAWVHHGGIYWIANAPTERMNEFQSLAEQQNLFLFVATNKDLLYALPQYLAQLAILVAVYGASRRLGFVVRPAACSTFLFATFGIVAYEATTPQNDLVAASLPAAAACLLLGAGGRLEAALAGIATGMGVGVKVSTVLVWPILAWLALIRRKTVVAVAAGAAAGFVTVGCWSFVLNVVHTGHLLGHGEGRVEYTASPSFHGSLVRALSILYLTMDLSVLWPVPIVILATAGLLAAALGGWYALRRASLRQAIAASARIAVPFLAPCLVAVGAGILAFATRRLGVPVRGPGGTYSQESTMLFGGLNNSADDSYSAFGPVGGVVLIGIPIVTAAAFFARKVDARHLALACAMPSFLILLSLGSGFNPWLARFLIIPAALAAPLFGRLFRDRATIAAYLLVSVVVIGFGISRDQTKRLFSEFGAPWHLSHAQALAEDQQPRAGRGFDALQKTVPLDACIGAVLGNNSPSYLLGGANFRRRVVYLSFDGAVPEAAKARLTYVAIADEPPQQPVARRFRSDGWTIRSLGGYWLLATAPHPGSGAC